MSEFLPKEVRDGLKEAHRRNLARKARFRIKAGERTIPIIDLWENGFTLDADDAPQLRGLIDLFDGGRHMSQCLVVASSEDAGVMTYEFKRNTEAKQRPARDYARDPDAPVALLPDMGTAI